jgi:CheY-like chemotaxis protein
MSSNVRSLALGAIEGLDVLVVDDNTAVRHSMASILRKAGYTVGEAEDGIAALTTLSSTHVGAVVLDVRMPRINGLTLLDALPAPPPVVILTAYHDDSEVLRRRRKVFAYAQKPVSPKDLRALVQQALGSSSHVA